MSKKKFPPEQIKKCQEKDKVCNILSGRCISPSKTTYKNLNNEIKKSSSKKSSEKKSSSKKSSEKKSSSKKSSEKKCSSNKEDDKVIIVFYNKGTGAGGSQTNHTGLKFENKTDNESLLLEAGFKKINIDEKRKFAYYLEQKFEEHTIRFVKQNGLKYYMKSLHNIKVFREVDEAYIIINNITGNITVKILEKKYQNSSGSVEDKLCLGYYFKFIEYPNCLGDEFKIEYAFCISSFLKEKYLSDTLKWNILRKSNENNNIPVFFGDDKDYYYKLDGWINS